MLDANILVRAVLGRRVRTIITTYGNTVEFFAPDVAFAEAREHLPTVLAKRRTPVEPGMALLEWLGEVIQTVDFGTYSVFEEEARSGRLACAGRRSRSPLPDLDGRRRFLRRGYSHLDDGSRGAVPPRLWDRLRTYAGLLAKGFSHL